MSGHSKTCSFCPSRLSAVPRKVARWYSKKRSEELKEPVLQRKDGSDARAGDPWCESCRNKLEEGLTNPNKGSRKEIVNRRLPGGLLGDRSRGTSYCLELRPICLAAGRGRKRQQPEPDQKPAVPRIEAPQPV